ncbi:hypothetical protein A6P39_003820 [Streptomyces sp. FXJ1.172]|uniref:hypothetical protein n=1 Tax=Streptomyces sp. FXJ1.172 TaxID=710705 RepID=UPI000AD02A85
MATPLPSATREIRLVTAPEGLPGPEHFAVVTATAHARPRSSPRPQPVLPCIPCAAHPVFPVLRTLIGGALEGVPLPPVNAGDVLFGPAVGEVVGAGPGSPLQPGDTVTHLLGWREHALVAAGDCAPVGDVLSEAVAHLSSGRPPTVRSPGSPTSVPATPSWSRGRRARSGP